MLEELEETKDEVFNAEYIQNGLENLKTVLKIEPALKNNPIVLMAIEQIENGLGSEYL